MPRAYKFMTTDETDERLVATARAQESDHWEHTQNAVRYERMLTSAPAGKWRDRVQHLLAETKSRLVEVDSILDAMDLEMPPPARIAAALSRLAAKEAAAQARRQ